MLLRGLILPCRFFLGAAPRGLWRFCVTRLCAGFSLIRDVKYQWNRYGNLSVRQASLASSAGAIPAPARGKPPHREPSLGFVKVTTRAKRRQGDTRAVTQVKPKEPRDKGPEADTLEYVEGHEKAAATGEGCWRFRRGLRARHAWQRKR